MIRKAKKNDAKQINIINALGWKNTYKGIFPNDFLDSIDPDDENNIQKIKNHIDQYAVCEIDGKIVAMARFGVNKKQYDASYAEIYAIYVDNDYQKQEIGTKLVKYIFKSLKKDFKYVLISTLKENSANDFYKKIGGEFIGNSEFVLNDKKYIENVYKYIL